MTRAWLDDWIEREFAGHGVAVRREDEPPIPGEPLMSMEIAKALLRRAVAESAEQGVMKAALQKISKCDQLDYWPATIAREALATLAK